MINPVCRDNVIVSSITDFCNKGIYMKVYVLWHGSGVWYQNKVLEQYAPCVNDDDLLLFLSKSLTREDDNCS